MRSKLNKKYTIGVDIGGTKMSAILFDGEKIITDYVLATPKDTLDHFLIMLNALIEPLLERAKQDKVKVKGVGLGVAGVIDYNNGRMLESPNISIINGVKLAEKLKEKINLPVVIDNDGNCFIRAEIKMGAGIKYKNGYGIIIGTGIGGGWWVNNKVYRAPFGGSGEPGEMIINFNSGIGLEKAYHKLTQNNPGALAEKAYRGDVLAEKTFQEVGEFLGMAFANIINIIAPEVIIIGGGVVESSSLFLAQTKKTMKEYIASKEAKKHIKIIKSKLGVRSGAIGAALLIV